MKVSVDQDACVACGNCEATAPDVFEIKEGKSHAKMGEVPKEQEDKVQTAAEDCPSEAISLS
ncbi:MAG: ferredoxin [Desulfurivibrionaceae bacterium]|nr:ferredoxin [Desulfurivibrionaceae bacterium]